MIWDFLPTGSTAATESAQAALIHRLVFSLDTHIHSWRDDLVVPLQLAQFLLPDNIIIPQEEHDRLFLYTFLLSSYLHGLSKSEASLLFISDPNMVPLSDAKRLCAIIEYFLYHLYHLTITNRATITFILRRYSLSCYSLFQRSVHTHAIRPDFFTLSPPSLLRSLFIQHYGSDLVLIFLLGSEDPTASILELKSPTSAVIENLLRLVQLGSSTNWPWLARSSGNTLTSLLLTPALFSDFIFFFHSRDNESCLFQRILTAKPSFLEISEYFSLLSRSFLTVINNSSSPNEYVESLLAHLYDSFSDAWIEALFSAAQSSLSQVSMVCSHQCSFSIAWALKLLSIYQPLKDLPSDQSWLLHLLHLLPVQTLHENNMVEYWMPYLDSTQKYDLFLFILDNFSSIKNSDTEILARLFPSIQSTLLDPSQGKLRKSFFNRLFSLISDEEDIVWPLLSVLNMLCLLESGPKAPLLSLMDKESIESLKLLLDRLCSKELDKEKEALIHDIRSRVEDVNLTETRGVLDDWALELEGAENVAEMGYLWIVIRKKIEILRRDELVRLMDLALKTIGHGDSYLYMSVMDCMVILCRREPDLFVPRLRLLIKCQEELKERIEEVLNRV